ncbi:hypothetical protein THIARS_60935 [Thiomonas delicata]|uniref:Uncharacterized protein n=1 Tax=Thiomonas delicata TaxID=364030 RepID=A0A238D4U3_THIDL|nr:hypothetical protein THIARS_60935 [Thiomonas delicata]
MTCPLARPTQYGQAPVQYIYTLYSIFHGKSLGALPQKTVNCHHGKTGWGWHIDASSIGDTEYCY